MRARVVIGGLFVLVVVAACASLPWKSASPAPARAYKEDEEVRISREFRREAKKKLRFVRNFEVDRYVDQIGRRLLAAMGPQPFDYGFFVVDERELNAFAVPGGSIYIHSGLIEKMQRTDELAGVMGHEIVHVKGHHMARMAGPDLLSLAGLLGVFLGGGAGQAAGALGQAVAFTRQLAYARQLEQEADTLGIKYMAAAGYDPAAAISFLKIIDQERVLNPVDVPPYLMTHPLTQDRISNAEAALRSLRLEPVKSSEPEGIRRIKILLRLERGDTASVIAEQQELVERAKGKAEERHLLGLAYHQAGNWELARENYEAARRQEPRLPGIDRDLGRLYTQTKQFRLAREALERAIALAPKEALNYVYLGELNESESNLREAAGAYLNAHNLAPLWPEPAQRLGTVYGKLNRLGDAHYYLGRAMLLQDEYESTIRHWERALKIFDENSPRGQILKAELDSLRERGR
ncbi:MAG TPA: M48 family metalloprotease [Candidatus Acidoferrales bacterium]|nr:M48 family metalloprotease [Candidatus Acidoferrales bacterium]